MYRYIFRMVYGQWCTAASGVSFVDAPCSRKEQDGIIYVYMYIYMYMYININKYIYMYTYIFK